jgi:hypothetical protein
LTTVAKEPSEKRQLLNAVMISVIVGFYDGFIGPGTGSFSCAFIALMVFILARFQQCQNRNDEPFDWTCLFVLKKIISAIVIPVRYGGWLS